MFRNCLCNLSFYLGGCFYLGGFPLHDLGIAECASDIHSNQTLVRGKVP